MCTQEDKNIYKILSSVEQTQFRWILFFHLFSSVCRLLSKIKNCLRKFHRKSMSRRHVVRQTHKHNNITVIYPTVFNGYFVQKKKIFEFSQVPS